MDKRSPSFMPVYVSVLFAVCLGTLLVSAFVHYDNLQKLKSTNAWVDHTWNVKDRLKSINLLLMDAESGTRGYFLSNDAAYLRPLTTAKEQLPSEFKTLEALVKDNPHQRAKLDELRALFDARLKLISEAISVFEAGGLSQIVTRAKNAAGRDVMDEVRLLDLIMEKEELELLAARRSRFYEEYDRSLWITIGINALTTLVLLIFYRMIRTNFEKRRVIENELKLANENLETTVLARTEQLSDLSRHLLKVSEEEKAKLARELHDEMGSSLTAVSMDISMMIEKLKKIDLGMVEQLRRAKQTLLETVNLKRRIIDDLRPSMLDHLGLASSIRHHYEQISAISSLPCEVETDEDFENLDPAWSIALFRIAQESLNNIVKYAKAKNVKLSLHRNNEGFFLQISDDGIGIPKNIWGSRSSHGLLGMRERALLLGGRFDVKAGKNGGTVVEAFLPNPK